MRIDILTVVPELLESPLSHSIVGRAIKKGIVDIHVHNLRKYGLGPRANVDDYSYGGDAGMVMMVEPVDRMIEELKAERDYDEVIYMSPDGERLNQGISNELSLKENLIILCGHYKGIDHRIREHLVTREISVGDYVVSGGEIPAALLADSIIRLIPGALTDETSALSDSFQDGLLSPPVYTRPADYKGWKVPDVLLSGNPKLIRAWQDEQALERTKALRPERKAAATRAEVVGWYRTYIEPKKRIPADHCSDRVIFRLEYDFETVHLICRMPSKEPFGKRVCVG